jgi:hypothetical protein
VHYHYKEPESVLVVHKGRLSLAIRSAGHFHLRPPLKPFASQPAIVFGNWSNSLNPKMSAFVQDDAIVALAEARRTEYQSEKKRLSDDYVASSVHIDDGIHNGLEFPTEEEIATLRRVSDNIPWSAYCEIFHRT